MNLADQVNDIYEKVVQSYGITNIEYISKNTANDCSSSSPLTGTYTSKKHEIVCCTGISKTTQNNGNSYNNNTFTVNDETLVKYIRADIYDGYGLMVKKYFIEVQPGAILTFKLYGFSSGANYYDFYRVCTFE